MIAYIFMYLEWYLSAIRTEKSFYGYSAWFHIISQNNIFFIETVETLTVEIYLFF